MKNPNKPRRPAQAGMNADSRNAITYTGPLHALRVEKYILPDEDPAEFLPLLHDHLDRLQPVGVGEEFWVLHIAVCQWRLNRTLRMRAGESALLLPLTALAGYETSLARSLARSHRILKIFQATRPASARPARETRLSR